jgi:hypothetical protein
LNPAQKFWVTKIENCFKYSNLSLFHDCHIIFNSWNWEQFDQNSMFGLKMFCYIKWSRYLESIIKIQFIVWRISTIIRVRFSCEILEKEKEKRETWFKLLWWGSGPRGKRIGCGFPLCPWWGAYISQWVESFRGLGVGLFCGMLFGAGRCWSVCFSYNSCTRGALRCYL